MKTILFAFLLLPLVLFAGPRPADYEKQVAANELKAIALYPDAGAQTSALWKALDAEMVRISKTNPAFFDDPAYPLMLAAKVASAMGVAPAAAAPAPGRAPAPALAPMGEWVRPAASSPTPPLPPTAVEIAAAQAEIQKPSGDFEAYRAAKNLLRAAGLASPVGADVPQRTLPRNWIDPAQADANWNAQQLKNSIDANTAAQRQAADELRWKQQQLDQKIRDLQRSR